MQGFHTTRWSLVSRAAAADPQVASRALGELCEQYWQPLYAFLRRSGHDETAALDQVQSFCVELLDGGSVRGAAPGRGAFRSYLIGALRHFVANTERAERTRRRGGGVTTWSFDAAEARYSAEPQDHRSPERVFERTWALGLLQRANQRLRAEYTDRGREALFAALEPALVGDDAARHAEIAAGLRMTPGAVKVALHRLRTRLRELIRDEVAQTVDDEAAIDAELQHLLAALAG